MQPDDSGLKAALNRIVRVQWEDTTNIAAWQTLEEAKAMANGMVWRAENIGYLIHYDATCLIVASRCTEAGSHFEHVGLVERIPRRAVTGLTVL